MLEFVVSPESIAMVAGVILSLLFSYIPGLRAWFDKFNAEQKRLWMLLMLALVAGSSFGLACGGILAGVACTTKGAVDVVWAFVLAVIANQSIYAISPQVGKSAQKD